jgi:hypothetical protein
LALLAVGPARSATAEEGFQVRWKISYVSGLNDLKDAYLTDIEMATGLPLDLDSSDFIFPVGISLYPQYQWDNGLFFGGGIGPFIFGLWDVQAWYDWDYWDETYYHWEVPVSLHVGYMFFADGPVSAYVRAGPSYHIAGGDFYDGSNIGVTAAAGVEFLRTSHFAMGVEAAYDSAEVKIGDEDRPIPIPDVAIKTAEWSVGLCLVFK